MKPLVAAPLQKRSPLLGRLWANQVSSVSPEVENDVLTSRPGASVNLTCPGWDPRDNATVHWVLRSRGAGSHHSRWAGMGRTLLLRSVQLNSSGNYLCYQDGRWAGTVHLLVEGEYVLGAFAAAPCGPCASQTASPPDPSTPVTSVAHGVWEKAR